MSLLKAGQHWAFLVPLMGTPALAVCVAVHMAVREFPSQVELMFKEMDPILGTRGNCLDLKIFCLEATGAAGEQYFP